MPYPVSYTHLDVYKRQGIKDAAPAWLVNQLCGSGLRAVAIAAQQIQTGQASIVAVSYTHLDVYKRQILLIIFAQNFLFNDILQWRKKICLLDFGLQIN